jgi:hypothetical protein
MGGLFGSKPKTTITNSYKFSDDDGTRKEPGIALPVVYGRARVQGNVVHRKIWNGDQSIEQAVSLCWGPVYIDLHSIRINEKLPHYVDGVLNPAIGAVSRATPWVKDSYNNLIPGTYVTYGGKTYYRNETFTPASIGDDVLTKSPPPEAPMFWTEVVTTDFIPNVHVWRHAGNLDAVPTHGLEYGLNRTAYLMVYAQASEKLTQISRVEVDVERPPLFTEWNEFTTPIPAQIEAAFPTGIRSSNPIAAALEYQLNLDFGANRDPALYSDFSTWIAAIKHCDVLLASGTLGKEHRWSCGVYLGKNKDDTHSELIEELLNIAGAKMFHSNGVVKCWYPRKQTPVPYTLDLSNFEPDGLVTADMMEIPNLIEISYKPSSADGEERKVAWEDSPRITDWREVSDKYDMPGIPSRTQAARMANYLGRSMFAQRKQLAGKCDQQFLILEPGDVIPVTIATPDTTWFTNKLFYVDEFIPENKDGDCEISLLEYGGDTLFNDSMANTLETNDPIRSNDPSVGLPDPGSTPINPSGITLNTGSVDRKPARVFYIDVSWTIAPQPQYMHHRHLIYRRESLSDPWQLVHSTGPTQMGWRDFEVEPVIKDYYYAVVSETSSGISGELPAEYHAYQQKLTLDKPPTPLSPSVITRADSLREIRWLDPDPLPADFEGYVVTVNPGATYEESFAVPAHDGVLTATKCTTNMISAAGTWTVAVHSRDWWGNLSEPLLIIYTVQAPPNPDRFMTARFRGQTRLEFSYETTAMPGNFAGMELRYQDKELVDWATAIPLFQDILYGPTIDLPLLPNGKVTVLGKAVDTFGNRSDDYVAIVFESQGIVLNNVVQDIDHRALGFPGTKTNATVSSGDLVADSSGQLMYDAYNERAFFTADASNFYNDTYKEITYETQFTVAQDGLIYLEKDITGTYSIEFLQPTLILFYESDSDPMYPSDGSSMYVPVTSAYAAWPGIREALANETYGFRVKVAAGVSQAKIEEFTIKVDVEDMYEDVNDLFVPISGIRVPTVKEFQDIKGLSITLQWVTGYTSATSCKIIDKDFSLGPLIQAFDKDGNAVEAYVDVTVKGY